MRRLRQRFDFQIPAHVLLIADHGNNMLFCVAAAVELGAGHAALLCVLAANYQSTRHNEDRLRTGAEPKPTETRRIAPLY